MGLRPQMSVNTRVASLASPKSTVLINVESEKLERGEELRGTRTCAEGWRGQRADGRPIADSPHPRLVTTSHRSPISHQAPVLGEELGLALKEAGGTRAVSVDCESRTRRAAPQGLESDSLAVLTFPPPTQALVFRVCSGDGWGGGTPQLPLQPPACARIPRTRLLFVPLVIAHSSSL